jgi:hypothetical protein
LIFVASSFAISAGSGCREPNFPPASIFAALFSWAGEGRRLVINQPPRSLKSICVSVAYVAYPPNGRLPPQTPEAQRAAAADREFFLALQQSTDACKNKEPVCAGGKYDPTPSPRFSEPPPRYHAGNVARLNRSDGPEDDALSDRCPRRYTYEFLAGFPAPRQKSITVTAGRHEQGAQRSASGRDPRRQALRRGRRSRAGVAVVFARGAPWSGLVTYRHVQGIWPEAVCVVVPDLFSARMTSQPAVRKAASWIDKS